MMKSSSDGLFGLQMLESGRQSTQGIRVGHIKKVMAEDYGNIIGRHMNTQADNLKAGTEAFNDASTHIMAASEALHQQMNDLSRKSKEAVSRAKDSAAQMTDAMNKITKLVGPDFEKRLEQLVVLTDCLERLQSLQDRGSLEAMISAINKGK